MLAPTYRPRHPRLLIRGLVAFLTLTTGWAMNSGGAGAAAGVLVVAATGSFDTLAAGTTVAGVDSPSGAQQFPYTFTATCDAQACPTSGATYVWTFGDGTSATSTTGPAASHAYTTPGVYQAVLAASTSTGYGQSTVTVLVSPRFADADASTNTAGDASPANRAAIWTVAAYRIMGSCQNVTGAVGVGSQTRPAFCGYPAADLNAPTLTTTTLNNGSTGAGCYTAASTGSGFIMPPYENCGLQPASYLVADSAAGSVTGNPLNTCGLLCQASLASAGELSTSGAMVLATNNCASGYLVQAQGTHYVAVPGVASGCVSRGQFYQSLITALYGASNTPSGPLASAAAACPGDSASLSGSPYASYVERASALGLTTTWLGTTNCNLNAAITKGEAYRIIAQATGTPAASTCSGYRDLTDETLGHGTLTPDPQCLSDLALVATGVPVVDSTTCVDGGGGTCFNAYDPLSRAGLATLLADLVNGLPSPTNTAYNPTGWGITANAAGVYDGAVIQSSPQAFYELNDSISAAFDASGHNAYGLYGGTVTHSSSGPQTGSTAGSVTLSGSGYVAVPSPYTGSGSTTTSLWFSTTGNGPLLAGQSSVVGATPTSYITYLAIRNGLLVTGSATGTNDVASGQVVNNGHWHQAVFVTSATGQRALYLDGNLIARSSAGTSVATTTNAQVGAGYASGAWSYFSGSISGVATWSSALSAAQVQSLWSYSSRTNPWSTYTAEVATSSPWGFWRLNGGSTPGCVASSGPGGTVCDSSANNQNLTWASGSASTCGAVAGAPGTNAGQIGNGPTNDTTSMEYNGSLGSCVATGSGVLGSTYAINLEAWIKPEAAPASSGNPGYIVSTGPVTNGVQAVLSVNSSCEAYSAGGISFELISSAWMTCVTVPSIVVTPGQWYDIMASWSAPSNSSVTSGQMTLYVNGVAQSAPVQTVGTLGHAPISLGTVAVGGNGSTSTNNLFAGSGSVGGLADVAVYLSTLSTTTIAYHYCAAKVNADVTSC